MLKRNLALKLILPFILILLCSDQAFAASAIKITEGTSITTTNGLIERLLNAYVSFMGLGAFVAFVVAGFTYLMSGANAERAGKAKRIMFYAILALILTVLSYSLFSIAANMLNSIFGK